MPFKTTHWSMVYAAGGSQSTEARQALETLCSTYWRPLYQFARRRGLGDEEARDMTQEFFTQLLERHALNQIDHTKGKFRSFLLASFTNMLNNEWDRQNAKKRRPAMPLVPLTGIEDKAGLKAASFAELTPELAFDREWALTILREAMSSLEHRYKTEGKADTFEILKPHLTMGAMQHSYSELSAQLGISESGAKVAVHRARKRYREAIRTHVANTVQTEDEIDNELRYLLEVLAHCSPTGEQSS